MRALFGLLIAASISTVSAQTSIGLSPSNFPKCAQMCVQQGISQSSCAKNDTACLCDDETFSNSLIQCLPKACNDNDGAEAVQVGQTICDQANYSTEGIPATATATASTGSKASTTPQSSGNAASKAGSTNAASTTSSASKPNGADSIMVNIVSTAAMALSAAAIAVAVF